MATWQGHVLAWLIGLAVLATAMQRREVIVAAGLAAGLVAGGLAAGRAADGAPVPSGRVDVRAVAISDSVEAEALIRPIAIGEGDGWAAWQGPVLLATGADAVVAGESLVIGGRVREHRFDWRGRRVGGVLEVSDLRVTGTPSPWFAAGNWLRHRIQSRLGTGPAESLLTGFLIGDVNGVPGHHLDRLRRSGLSHFVAVSGSNVALFLAAWWLALGPLAWRPRRRAVLGLAGLVVFVIATRWEPSVVRAAVMASAVLSGRLVGRDVDAWSALGIAVLASLVAAPQLAGAVGFQLSVGATAGVLAGAGMFAGRRPAWAWMALGATVSAQLAVLPLLLWQFGTVPLVAAPANVVAAPLVAAATIAGGVGAVLGPSLLADVGAGLAGAVLALATVAAEWPQLSAATVAVTLAVGVVAWRLPRLRGLAAMSAALVAVLAVLPSGGHPGARLVVLDVGQGDAILLRSSQGHHVLVDGGPSPARLRSRLGALGVRRVDLMILSHRHADHVTGLGAVVEMLPVDRLWVPEQPDPDGVVEALGAAVAARGGAVERPPPGRLAQIGDLRIEVLGPLRRYASPNDGSLVLRVAGPAVSVLLPGDVEVIAQRELGAVPADVLKVPHQGAATSDPDWLLDVSAQLAIISVGPNSFGHPDPEVVAVLETAGVAVRRTDLDGDVTVRLDRPLDIVPP